MRLKRKIIGLRIKKENENTYRIRNIFNNLSRICENSKLSIRKKQKWKNQIKKYLSG